MLRRALPGISDQTIRLVLIALRTEELIATDEASGPNTQWVRRQTVTVE